MKIKKTLSIILAVILICGTFSGCSKDSDGDSTKEDSKGGTIKFTYWQAYGEDSFYYTSYNQNPVIKYVLENNKFNGKAVEIEFVNPMAGSERDNFNILLSTGEYCDVIDMSVSTETPAQLFQEGIIIDLTEYVKNHMPNYMKYLEENPDVADLAYSIVDGEKRILSLNEFRDTMAPNFEGFCYRRDWIVKYGSNPSTGAKFTSGYTDPNNEETYYDDVVFPSGGTDPVYISDWEWMLAIFKTAIDELGIKGGYGISLPAGGYYGTGDLTSAFGGGFSGWYLDSDGMTIKHGATGDTFRTYLQAMTAWYQNGWIDTAFPEHSNDIFYAIDTTNVIQGKVGMWCGRRSTLGTQIDDGNSEYSKGAMVFGCTQPINDIYGSDAQKNKIPDAFYQFNKLGGSTCITKKMSEEGLIAYLEICDYFFNDEGAELIMGFSKEQAEEYNIEFYKKFNIENGAYEVIKSEDGRMLYKKTISDMLLYNASIANRWNIKKGLQSRIDEGLDRFTDEAVKKWDYYINTAAVLRDYNRFMTSEQSKSYSKTDQNINSFLDKNVPGIIKGTSSYSALDDAGWDKFSKDLLKYRPETVTEIYQGIIDMLKK